MAGFLGAYDIRTWIYVYLIRVSTVSKHFAFGKIYLRSV